VGGEDNADGFTSDLGCDSSSNGLLGHQSDGPPCASLRRRPTDHRDDRRTLHTVKARLGFAAWLVREGGAQVSCAVPLPDTRHFPRKRPSSLGGRAHGHPLIKEFEHSDATPRTGGQRLAPPHRREFGAVLLGQCQAGETLRSFHPLLRSEVDPGIKRNVITKGRSKD
jgi:hypothetical protein